MQAIQTQPEVIVGLIADLPSPASIPQGYFYFATDTVQLFLSAIDPVTQARTWDPIVSGSTPFGIPLDQIAFGSATQGITSSPKLTYDPVTGQLTVRDSNGLIMMVVDGAAANRIFELFNAAGTNVFSYNTLTSTLSYAVPASPQYFVSNAGSDSNPGTSLLPLASPQEALRRLSISGWSGQPIVTILAGALALGASPMLNFPMTPDGASPILLQGTYITALPATVPTGGTAFVANPPTLATITSAAPGAANAYRGMFSRFTTGALAGKRFVVDSNNGAGGFSITGFCSTAPSAATTFLVEDLASQFTWTGTLQINAPGGAWIDGIDFATTTDLRVYGIIQDTNCRFKTSAVGNVNIQCAPNALWFDGFTGFGSAIFAIPSTVFPGGSRWDGSAGSYGEMKINFQLCAFLSCGMFMEQARSTLALAFCLFTSSRQQPTFVSTGAAITLRGGAFGSFQSNQFNGGVANQNVILVDEASDLTIITSLSGTNANAGIVPMVVSARSSVKLRVQPTITGSGGAGVAECKVGANAATTWALAFGGLAANSTDLANASPQICRIGP